MCKIKGEPYIFLGVFYAKLSYRNNSIMDKNQGQPVDNDLLQALKEEEQFLVIDPLSLFLIIVQE